MKKIIIQYDYSRGEVLSYIGVLKQIEAGAPLIYTNCLEFFSFTYLDQGYEVEVRNTNGDYIKLSELLEDTKNEYTYKEIRKAHDVRKLLVANHFWFKEAKRVGLRPWGQLKGNRMINKETKEKVEIIAVWKQGSPVGERIMFDLRHLKKTVYGEFYIESLDKEQLKEYYRPLEPEEM